MSVSCQERKCSGHRGISVSCQIRTNAVQQNCGYVINDMFILGSEWATHRRQLQCFQVNGILKANRKLALT
jgi:hypothetical protein